MTDTGHTAGSPTRHRWARRAASVTLAVAVVSLLIYPFTEILFTFDLAPMLFLAFIPFTAGVVGSVFAAVAQRYDLAMANLAAGVVLPVSVVFLGYVFLGP